jgi:hypothetical protein
MATIWTARHYNALAKEIRELFPIYDGTEDMRPVIERANIERRAILTTLALSLAERFKDDNPRFDPIKFLNACSPNLEQYPLSEFWWNDED